MVQTAVCWNPSREYFPPLSNHRKNSSGQLIFATNWQLSLDNAIHLCPLSTLLWWMQLFSFSFGVCFCVCISEDVGRSRPNNVKPYFSCRFWFALDTGAIHQDQQSTAKAVRPLWEHCWRSERGLHTSYVLLKTDTHVLFVTPPGRNSIMGNVLFDLNWNKSMSSLGHRIS